MLGSAQAQGNLAEYYAAFFVLFAVLEFNKVVGSTLLNGLGTWYVVLYQSCNLASMQPTTDHGSAMHLLLQLLPCATVPRVLHV